MLDRLSRILRTPEQQSVGPSRSPQRQLIQRQAFPSRLLDPSPSRSSEAERSDGQLGDLQQAIVVGDGAHHDDRLALVGFRVLWRGGDGGDAGD